MFETRARTLSKLLFVAKHTLKGSPLKLCWNRDVSHYQNEGSEVNLKNRLFMTKKDALIKRL